MITFTAIQYQKKQAEFQIQTTLFNKENSNSKSYHNSSTYQCPSVIQINLIPTCVSPLDHHGHGVTRGTDYLCVAEHWHSLLNHPLCEWISVPQSSRFYPVPPDVTASKLL